MIFHPTAMHGVYDIELILRQDERGWFTRLLGMDELAAIGHTKTIAQVNLSHTKRSGTIRGMHFQKPPMAEVKIVGCLSGRVYDVVVDLRQHSPTFLKWQAFELASGRNRMVYIPEGCAHGFQALQDDVELLYFHSANYSPEHEAGILYNDRQIAIEWPCEVTEVSARDASFPRLDGAFAGIVV